MPEIGVRIEKSLSQGYYANRADSPFPDQEDQSVVVKPTVADKHRGGTKSKGVSYQMNMATNGSVYDSGASRMTDELYGFK